MASEVAIDLHHATIVAVDAVPPNPSNSEKDRPMLDESDVCTPDLRMMLITPAIASEPYCAAAPSLRISIRSMALTGIAFRSTLVDPRPTD
jgi:hypothetical protein